MTRHRKKNDRGNTGRPGGPTPMPPAEEDFDRRTRQRDGVPVSTDYEVTKVAEANLSPEEQSLLRNGFVPVGPIAGPPADAGQEDLLLTDLGRPRTPTM